MALLLAAALIAVAAMVAYPLVGLVAGLALVVFLATATAHARRTRLPLPLVPARVSPDRKVALLAAWRDLNDIERGVGPPPTSHR